MSMEKKVTYLNQFGSYGDRLRQKLINRLAHETKNLAKADRTVLKPSYIPSVCAVKSTTTFSPNRLSSRSELSRIDNSVAKAVSTGKVVDPA